MLDEQKARSSIMKNKIWLAKSNEGHILVHGFQLLGSVLTEWKDTVDVWKSTRQNWQN